jgi:hypothetical protein
MIQFQKAEQGSLLQAWIVKSGMGQHGLLCFHQAHTPSTCD